MDMDERTIHTEQPVYVVYEYRSDTDDRLRHVFENDAETLKELLDHYSENTEIVFHAADPGHEHLQDGDHYLTKRHGVSISHGLVD